ncbi:MAG TPA: nodulation protein NodJ [Deltaproteobacteria bacterium]|nr:nodulation protein NodJ [Deltaproteobacteria bacterium]
MFTYRIFKVWRRDFLVWQKYFLASLVANFGEPLLYLFALGYGLGRMVPEIQGMTYPQFIAPAILITTVMNSASFETTFSSYTRMEVQKTFNGIATTPVSMSEVVGGEILWAATKAMVSSSVIFLVLALFGLISSVWVALMPLVMACTGLLFASMGMLMTSFARSYDHFTYYFTMFVSPMFLFSGTFFPLDNLPAWAKGLAYFLPLTYPVQVARHLFAGEFSFRDIIYLGGMLTAAAAIGVFAVKRLVRRLIV